MYFILLLYYVTYQGSLLGHESLKKGSHTNSMAKWEEVPLCVHVCVCMCWIVSTYVAYIVLHWGFSEQIKGPSLFNPNVAGILRGFVPDKCQ